MATSGTPDYTSALYAFVVMAYATLAVAQYTKNGTTQKIKDQKARAERLWQEKFAQLRENANICPEEVRSQFDLIKVHSEHIREYPFYALFVAIAFAALFHLWNASVIVFELNGDVVWWLGMAVVLAYTAMVCLIVWIGIEIRVYSNRASKLKNDVDTWIGKAEVSLDTVKNMKDISPQSKVS